MKGNNVLASSYGNPKSLREHVITSVLRGIVVKDIEKLRRRLEEVLSFPTTYTHCLGEEPSPAFITSVALRCSVPAAALIQTQSHETKRETIEEILSGAHSAKHTPQSPKYKAAIRLQGICSTVAGSIRIVAGIDAANDIRVGLARLLEIQERETSADEIISVMPLNQAQRTLLYECEKNDAAVFTGSKNPETKEELEEELEKLEAAQTKRVNLSEILRGRDRENTIPTLILHQSPDESPTARASKKILRRWKNSRENEWIVRHIGLLIAITESLFSRNALRQRREDLKNYAQWQGETFRLQRNRFHGNRKELAEELARQVRKAKREGETCDIIHPEEDVFLLFQDLLEALQSPKEKISVRQLIESLVPMIQLRLSAELAPSDHELELLAMLRLMETLSEKLKVQCTAETPKTETL